MDRGRMLRGTGRRHSTRGAAALEFALVAPVLFLILFGILEYGLYFHDTLAANEAVREAARSAVVETGTGGCAASPGSFGLSVAQCEAKAAVDRSDTAVMVDAPDGWTKGGPLTVCLQFPSSGGFGFLPLPHDGYVHAKLSMSIEETSSPPTGSTSADPAPNGQDWSWC